LPAPIDVQIVGNDLEATEICGHATAESPLHSGTVDLRIQQPFDQPKLHINVDRTKAGQIGFTERDIAQNLLISLSEASDVADLLAEPKNA